MTVPFTIPTGELRTSAENALRSFFDSATFAVQNSIQGTGLENLAPGYIQEARIVDGMRGGVRFNGDVAEFSPQTAQVLVQHFMHRGRPEYTPDLASEVDAVFAAAMRRRLGVGDPTRSAFGAAFLANPEVRRQMLDDVGMADLAQHRPTVGQPRRMATAETIATGLRTLSSTDIPLDRLQAELANHGREAARFAGELLLQGQDPAILDALENREEEAARLGQPIREAFEAVAEDELGIEAREGRGHPFQAGYLRGIRAITEARKVAVDVRARAAERSDALADRRQTAAQVGYEQAKIEAGAAFRSTKLLKGVARAKAIGWATGATMRLGRAAIADAWSHTAGRVSIPRPDFAGRRRTAVPGTFFIEDRQERGRARTRERERTRAAAEGGLGL